MTSGYDHNPLGPSVKLISTFDQNFDFKINKGASKKFI